MPRRTKKHAPPEGGFVRISVPTHGKDVPRVGKVIDLLDQQFTILIDGSYYFRFYSDDDWEVTEWEE